MFLAKFVGKIKTQILCSVTLFFFREIVPFMKQYGKSGSAEQATDDNMAHARFMLGI